MTIRDPTGSRFGMWLFLYSEIMLFTGLFLLYAAYFRAYRADFAHAGRDLSLAFGAANTGVLLASSFMAAAALTALRRARRAHALAFVLGAVALGGVFLVNKYFEWGHKFHLGLYPNSPRLAAGPPGEALFYGLYFAITGLHGLHVVIGLVLLALCAVLLARGRLADGHDALLDHSALYWHLVDLIWIFIFPLFYLIL